MGYDGVLTTFLSYGAVAPRRQGQIIQALARWRLPRGQWTWAELWCFRPKSHSLQSKCDAGFL